MLTDGVTLPTVTVTSLLVAVAGDAQGSLLVITTFTLSPLAKVDEVNTLLFVPAFTPFTIHWYVGVVPPLVGVAVKVTEPSEHIDTVVGVIDTDGVTLPTVTVTSLLVAVAGDAHGSLLVITTFTLSPLAKVDVCLLYTSPS